MKSLRRAGLVAKWLSGTILSGFICIILFISYDHFSPVRVQDKYSQVIRSSDGTIMHVFLSHDDKWRIHTNPANVSPLLIQAIIRKEDRFFYSHPGINPVSMVTAMWRNIIMHKKTSGASTITMQVTRLIDPAPRTYLNKTKEILRAMQLEWHHTKDEILAMYLTLIPFGGNIEGVEAASLIYFKRPPIKLSPAQAVLLSIIPNRPTSLNPSKGSVLFLQTERNKWLKRLNAEGVIDNEALRNALKEPVMMKRKPLPVRIPHLANRLRREHQDKDDLTTTIDHRVQEKVETITRNHISLLKLSGIHNAAVMVIRNADRAVLAYMGSPDFNDDVHSGQVDGVMAVRSPGSTLKPFLYGLAFDAGLATPKTVMNDVPADYMGYRPGNFNAEFSGKVTIEKALAMSLNVPAVKMLNLLGVPVLMDGLTGVGFDQIKKDRQKLGLSMILGGCGVTLEDLAGLYAALASKGVHRRLQLIADGGDASEKSVLKEESAWLLEQILVQLRRPDMPVKFENSMNIPRIAWKTGTSYGRRDGWSIGYNHEYTIGVWTGNFNGIGVPELTGSDIATPLLFDIFNVVDYHTSGKRARVPPSISSRKVCPESGLQPSELCRAVISDYYLPGISSVLTCGHLIEVELSTHGKTSYCSACKPSQATIKKVYEDYDPELSAWMRSENIPMHEIPPHNAMCTRIMWDNGPLIVSPVDRKEYLISKEDHSRIKLSCQTEWDVKSVYWYVNNRFFARVPVGEDLFITPVPGPIKISCSDDKGRNSDVNIIVGFF